MINFEHLISSWSLLRHGQVWVWKLVDCSKTTHEALSMSSTHGASLSFQPSILLFQVCRALSPSRSAPTTSTSLPLARLPPHCCRSRASSRTASPRLALARAAKATGASSPRLATSPARRQRHRHRPDARHAWVCDASRQRRHPHRAAHRRRHQHQPVHEPRRLVPSFMSQPSLMPYSINQRSEHAEQSMRPPAR